MTGNWLYRPAPRAGALARLFCFAHAGAAATVYRLWPAGLPAGLEVCAIQLPGRGARLQEASITTMPALLAALLPQLRPFLDLPFLFFGHSMGATLAREIADALLKTGAPLPKHLIVSGRRSPRSADPWSATRALSDAQFVVEINRRYGGIPAEVQEHADLMKLLLPSLRADIEILETLGARELTPLPCPISAFGGTHDMHATRVQLEGWRAETTAGFDLKVFEGGHFYLDPKRSDVLAEISAIVRPLLQAARQNESVE